MSELPIKLTLKSGAGYDAPWLTVDANDPSDLEFKVDALLSSSALEKSIALAELFKAANNAGPVVNTAPVQQPPAPVQPQGWGQPQQAPAPQWATGTTQQAAPAQSGPVNGSPHPEGRACPVCNNVIQYKAFNSKAGKALKMWACPNQRSKGDGHTTEWID